MVLGALGLGAALGFVLQRGRFCVTNAMRDVWVNGSTRWLTAFLLAIATQAVLVQVLLATGAIQVSIPQIAWAAVIGGSFLFGIGIVLAGGCATGTYYRSGEGLIGSWIALVFYALLASVMKFGALKPFNEAATGAQSSLSSIPDSLGISAWVLVATLVALTAVLVRRERAHVRPLAQPAARRRGVAHVLFEKAWSPFATAAVVGALAALAYPLSGWLAGKNSGLGITTPSANIVQFLTTGDTSVLGWGVFLVLGIIPGSYIAAKGSGEFHLRAPDARTAVRAVAGGSIMGVGAALAGGCTIGNSLVQTALFSYQGWVAFLFTFLGVGFAARVFVQTHRRAGAGATLATPAGAGGVGAGVPALVRVTP